jgi:hypothetical protein
LGKKGHNLVEEKRVLFQHSTKNSLGRNITRFIIVQIIAVSTTSCRLEKVQRRRATYKAISVESQLQST